MHRFASWAIAIFGIIGSSSQAQTPPKSLPQPDPANAPRLIEQLGSVDFRARESAGRELLRIGERALPALKAATKNTSDPEVQRRIATILERLETLRLVNPRRVTFQAKDKLPKDIVAEIAKQSGYVIQYQGNGEEKTRFSFNFEDTPFWEALDKISDAAGLTAYVNNDDQGTISLSYSDTYTPLTNYSGPFRLVPTYISTSRNMQLSNFSRRQPMQRQPEYVNLNFSIFSEPKAPIVGIGQATLLKAQDDLGATMLPPDPEGVPQISYYPPQVGYRSFNQSFGINLIRTNQRSTLIKELQGKVPVAILTEVRPDIVVDEILKVKKQKYRGRTLEMEVTKTDFANDVLTVDLSVRRLQGDPDDYNWTNTLQQRFEVLDASGVKYVYNGVSNQSNSPNLVNYTMQFGTPQANGQNQKAGKPARLQLTEWITLNREITFRFKEIPLP